METIANYDFLLFSLSLSFKWRFPAYRVHINVWNAKRSCGRGIWNKYPDDRQCQGFLEPQSEITTTTIQKRERRKGKKTNSLSYFNIAILEDSFLVFYFIRRRCHSLFYLICCTDCRRHQENPRRYANASQRQW